MKDKINYDNCMKRKCQSCKYYDYCFGYKPKKESKNESNSKIKKIKTLNTKIADAKNDVVIKYLNLHGYKVENTKESINEVYDKIRKEHKKIILEKQNEHFYKNGSYYTWEADIIVKEA